MLLNKSILLAVAPYYSARWYLVCLTPCALNGPTLFSHLPLYKRVVGFSIFVIAPVGSEGLKFQFIPMGTQSI